MNKPVLGLLLGAVLGAFDGLTALVSAPETAPQIMGIVIGSTVQGPDRRRPRRLVRLARAVARQGHARRPRWCRRSSPS